MRDIHKDIGEKLKATLDAAIGETALKAVKEKTKEIIQEIEDDLEYRVKDDLAYNLVEYVADMANKTIDALLRGNENEMRRYLGCERGAWTGRSDADVCGAKRPDDQWHQVINGTLSEYGGLDLRRKIADAYADLIKNERILDLENQVKCLVAQVNKLEAQKRDIWERRGEYA